MLNELFKPRVYSRRAVVALGQGLLATVLPFAPALAQSGTQKDWRFCGKCHQMFFDGYPDKGRCAAGGAHSAIGYNFSIEYSASRQQELPGRRRQYDWRFCNKCHTLFFDGYSNKGRCPRDGQGHVAQGYMFGLWDVGGPRFPGSRMQDNWRFCNKCHVLFFDGYPNKGRCPAGDGHVAQGLNFKLFFEDTAAPTKTAPPPAKPNISVSIPSSRSFRVRGSGFRGGVRVTIRVADDALNPNLSYHTTASSAGAIDATISIPCNPGRLHFSATDGTPDRSDRTGSLWSNTVTEMCR